MKKPEAWTAYDQGDPVYVYDASEADEYVTAIEARLAEVTAERDQLRNATHVASYERGIAEGRKQSEHNLNRLLDAVEALEDAKNRDVWDAAYASLRNLAAEIRKERS